MCRSAALARRTLPITAVSTRRNAERPEQQQVFVQVANFTAEPQKATVETSLDGGFLDAAEVEVPAGESKGIVFPLADGAVGELTARLSYELAGTTRDALRQDDVGYAALNDAGTGRVLVVTPGNVPLELALQTERAKRLAQIEIVPPATLESAEYRRAAANGEYELIIYDQCVPEEMPRANTLFMGRLPPGPVWRGREDAGDEGGRGHTRTAPPVVGPQIIDWDRASPLLAHVDMGDVVIADSLVVRPPAGGTILIESTAGPIAAIAPRDSYQDAVLGFEIVGAGADGSRTANTNWPIRPSFPTFWLNVLEYLAARGEEQLAASVRPGRPVELHAPPAADRLTVVDPKGRETVVPRSEDDSFRYTATDVPGVYQVRQGDAVVERFAVNLFDRAESDIGVRPTQDPESQTLRPADIRIGHVDAAPVTDRTPARRRRGSCCWCVPWPCWCWSGISTIAGCIFELAGMVVALDSCKRRVHGRERQLTMHSNLRPPRQKPGRAASTPDRHKPIPLAAFKRLVEDDTIRRVSLDEYQAKVKDVYGGPQGALLATCSMLSLHIPLGERMFRTRKFGLAGMKSILDVGSGAGQLAKHLFKYGDRDAQITCIDLSQPMLRRARHRLKSLRPDFITADLSNLPFADQSFDGVTCGYVLEHLPDPQVGLAELARVMRRGARMFLLTTEDSFSAHGRAGSGAAGLTIGAS